MSKQHVACTPSTMSGSATETPAAATSSRSMSIAGSEERGPAESTLRSVAGAELAG